MQKEDKARINPEFVDLNRRFYKATDHDKPEEAAQESYMLDLLDRKEGLNWSELFQHRLVVVLGEPGSGKSTEFQLQADKLQGQSQQAFYMELQRLVDEPFTAVLGEREQKAFQKWKDGDFTSYFFFDSVDDSKFKRTDDFLTALDRISVVLNDKELLRAKLFFSSRIFEWHPSTDSHALRRRFSISKLLANIKKIPETLEDASIVEERDLTTEDAPQNLDKSIDDPFVIHLAPLDRTQVRTYAQFRGLSDPAAFIQALDDHAWEFARRPLDVDWIIDYWREKGRLGSLTELIEHGLMHSLRETGSHKIQYPLTPEKARQGAETLAAASLFCRNLNFKVPDSAFHSAATALDADICLPDTWLPTERQALLDRPLFESALYGCIRFHHRRMVEYLAASWLTERISDNCPLYQLDFLLFAEHQGEYILRPTLAPVAAWLANGDKPHNKHVGKRLLQAAPGIYFSYGDPQQLPIEYKRQLLNALVSRYEDRQRAWLEYEPESIARLADPALAADVSSLILNRRVAASLRADMLSLVRYGRLTDCLETALQVVADPSEGDDIRQYAGAALRDCADMPMRARLADLVRVMPTLSSHLAGLLCGTLYPDVIDAVGLSDMLRKAEVTEQVHTDLPWTLKRHLQEKLTFDLAAPLLRVFLDLIHTAPHRDDGRDEALISRRYGWLSEVLPVVLHKVLEQIHIQPEDIVLSAQCVSIIENHRNYGGQNDKKLAQQLQDDIKHHPPLRREYFWQGVEHFRATHQRDPEWYGQIAGWHSLVIFDRSDFAWLVDDALKKISTGDRALALHFSFYLWQPWRLRWRDWFHLFRVQLKRPELRGLFWECTWQRIVAPARGFWLRHVQQKVLDKHWWSNKRFNLQQLRLRIRDYYLLHRYFYRLYSGRATAWLVNLSQEASSKQGSSRWAASDWSELSKKRGVLIARAVRHGCEISWTRHMPFLPHEKPQPNQTGSQTVAGLCGLQSLWQARKLDFSILTEEDVERATRYALNELNDFSEWLPELARMRSTSVRRVLRLCIQAEWRFPPERENVQEVLSKLSWRGERFAWLVAEDVMSQLHLGDPRHPRILDDALSILLKSPNPPLPQLTALASQRIRDYPPDSPSFITWLVLWIQLEAFGALTYLKPYLEGLPATTADDVVLRLCEGLRGDRRSTAPQLTQPDYLHPRAMRIMVPLVYRHIRPDDDIDHARGVVYTPVARDAAQDFRNALLQKFAQLDDPEIPTVLKELSSTPELAAHREWIFHLIEQHVSRRADLIPWSAADIRTFAKEFEIDPRNDTELYRIACWRLEEIKHKVEKTDNSLRDEVHQDWDEAKLRSWFQRKLREEARGRYTIPQEEEIDQQQRPDLRFENPKTSAVPVELKWAENWTAKQHLERLENQLVGQYLRAYNVRYGIYLLGYIGRQQHWDHPTESRRIDFGELVELIKQRAQELVRTRPGVEDLSVIAVDFTTSRR